MTKRQLFLIAGLTGSVFTVGCIRDWGTGLAECQISQSNDDTGEGYCPGAVGAVPDERPAQSVDLPEDPN